MKKFTLLVVLILLMSLTLVGCGGGGGSSSKNTIAELTFYVNDLNTPLNSSSIDGEIKFSYYNPDGNLVYTGWSGVNNKITVTYPKSGIYKLDQIFYRDLGDTDSGTSIPIDIQDKTFPVENDGTRGALNVIISVAGTTLSDFRITQIELIPR
ncbi:MAG: hypothetical protein LBR56_01710 [Sporomusaceae bacterium]|jgi:hypothetical protein|nr:hypothetical protein [Sporomusaceae bacterium]